jgi:DNA-binding MarR family transcriptional regulator
MDLDDKKFRADMGKRCACFNLRRASRLVTQKYDQALRPAGLTANQFSILIAAYNRDGLGILELAKILGMERTTLTRNLAILERLGFAGIHPGSDRRQRRVAITPKGKDRLKEALPLWKQAQEDMVARIGVDKWEPLLSGLQEVTRKA